MKLDRKSLFVKYRIIGFKLLHCRPRFSNDSKQRVAVTDSCRSLVSLPVSLRVCMVVVSSNMVQRGSLSEGGAILEEFLSHG